MNPASPSPLPPTQPEQAAAGPGGKVWKCGTLTYTFGGLVALFFWLLFGDFAWSMRDRSVGPMSNWYLSHLKVSNLLFVLLLSSFPAIVGMIVGPIVSVKSDRHRGRWGRRIPFLLVTTPIGALGIVGIGLTPWIAQSVHALFPNESKALVAVACFGVFWAIFELATIIGGAVFGGLINDVVPKEFLGRFQGLFRAVSLIDGMVFNYWIMGKVPDYFAAILVTVGIFYGVCFLWVCRNVREGEYPPPPPPDARSRGPLRAYLTGAGKYLRECFSNSYYLFVFIFLTISALTFSPVNVFTMPYATSLGVDMTAYGHTVAYTYVLSGILAYPLGSLADRFHPLRTTMATLLGYVVVSVWGYLYARTPETFLVAWFLHGALSGSYYTSSASLRQRLFPHEKFAQFSSAVGLVSHPISLVLMPLAGLFLDQPGGHPGQAHPVNPIYHDTFAMGCALAVISLVAGAVVYRRFVKLGGPDRYVAPEL